MYTTVRKPGMRLEWLEIEIRKLGNEAIDNLGLGLGMRLE